MSAASTARRLSTTDVYLKAEEVAFRQATLISVVSEHVRNDLVSRGVDARKILVNPNGADLGQLRAGRRRTRSGACAPSSGFADDDRVIGFTGTFGGWHGIDVLAAAIPRICAATPAREVPAHRRRHAQAAARRRSRAPRRCSDASAASAACRRPRARGC